MGINKGNLYSAKRVKKAKDNLLKLLEKEGYISSVVEVEVENLNEDAVSVTFNVNKGKDASDYYINDQLIYKEYFWYLNYKKKG